MVRHYTDAMVELHRRRPAGHVDSLETLLDEALYFLWLFAKHGTFEPTLDEKVPGWRDRGRRATYRFLREVDKLSQVEAIAKLAEREGVEEDTIRSSLYRGKRP